MTQRKPGRPSSLFSQAVRELLPGTEVKTPCKRRHPRQPCPGIKVVRKAAKRMGFKIIGRCRDGVIWVYRPK